VTTDSSILDRWNDELRRPKSAIVVRADQVFVHCAKAFPPQPPVGSRPRGASTRALPTAPTSSSTQGLLGESIASVVRAGLEEGYVAGLDYDRPEPVTT
jgi:hypothetical protein